MAMQETWFYSTWFGKCQVEYAYTVFQLYDSLRFRSTIYINVLISMSCLRFNNQILQKFEAYCMNMLLGLPQHLGVN